MLLLANLHLKLLMLSQSVTSNQVPNVHHNLFNIQMGSNSQKNFAMCHVINFSKRKYQVKTSHDITLMILQGTRPKTQCPFRT